MTKFEFVVYDDGTSRLSEFADERYVGTEYLDGKQTVLILMALRSKGNIIVHYATQMGRWVKRLVPDDRRRKARNIRG